MPCPPLPPPLQTTDDVRASLSSETAKVLRLQAELLKLQAGSAELERRLAGMAELERELDKYRKMIREAEEMSKGKGGIWGYLSGQ